MRGIDQLHNTTKTDFCIGIAGYPEKHIESPNMAHVFKYLKEKRDAGPQYIITVGVPGNIRQIASAVFNPTPHS